MVRQVAGLTYKLVFYSLRQILFAKANRYCLCDTYERITKTAFFIATWRVAMPGSLLFGVGEAFIKPSGGKG